MAPPAKKFGAGASRDDVLRWLGRFEEAERTAAMRNGPRPEWSIAISLSMIDAARAAGFLSRSSLSIRAAEDAAVRRTWQRLRVGLSK
jgi:hypothetical protein